MHQHLMNASSELFHRFGLSLSPVVMSLDQLGALLAEHFPDGGYRD